MWNFIQLYNKIKIMSNLQNDILMEDLFEEFIKAGCTEKEAEKLVKETIKNNYD